MSNSEERAYAARKGLIDQREKGSSSRLKPVLLEYEVLDHQTGWWNRKLGWVKQGHFKSELQAIRVIERFMIARNRLQQVYGPPAECKWRIDGKLYEGS